MPSFRRVKSKFAYGLYFGIAVLVIATLVSIPALGPGASTQPDVLGANNLNQGAEPEVTAVSNTSTKDYPLHTGITTTVFWIGEEPSSDNEEISNLETEWDPDPVKRLGYVDSPNLARLPSGHLIGRTPGHNDFYCALPLGEFDESGVVESERAASFWANEAKGLGESLSLFKGRWVQVEHAGKTALLQVIDTGPFSWSDHSYVWGNSKPSNKTGLAAGIDISPAAAAYLGIDGSASVNWRFIDPSEAEKLTGPWHDFAPIDNKVHW